MTCVHADDYTTYRHGAQLAGASQSSASFEQTKGLLGDPHGRNTGSQGNQALGPPAQGYPQHGVWKWILLSQAPDVPKALACTLTRACGSLNRGHCIGRPRASRNHETIDVGWFKLVRVAEFVPQHSMTNGLGKGMVRKETGDRLSCKPQEEGRTTSLWSCIRQLCEQDACRMPVNGLGPSASAFC